MSTTVLLVHQGTDDRAMYAEYLRAFGLRVTEAGTTEEGLGLAEEADLVITGLMVPGQYDGIGLIARIRERWTSEQKPVVVVTASLLPGIETQARSAGCDVFLAKPCLPDDLLAEVTRLLKPQ